MDKLAAIVHNPVDGPVRQAGGLRVFLGPGHHALGGIHMEHLRPAGRRRQGGAAAVGKEVQHPHRAVGRRHLFPDKVPVGSLLREHAGVLEVHGLHVEGQVVPVANLPPLGQLMVRPVSAAGIGADIAGIVLFPLGGGMGRAPDDLGIRANQNVFSPALQALAVRGIQHLIILPLIRNPQHGLSPFLY